MESQTPFSTIAHRGRVTTLSGELVPPDWYGLRGVIYQITATHVIPKRVPNAIDQSLQVPVISSRKSWLGTGTRRSAQPLNSYTATREIAPRAPALHSITLCLALRRVAARRAQRPRRCGILRAAQFSFWSHGVPRCISLRLWLRLSSSPVKADSF